MSDTEHVKLAKRLESALAEAQQHVQSLSALSRSDALGQAWSSQVTRCQSLISDAVKTCRNLLYELDVLIEEEDGCASTRRHTQMECTRRHGPARAHVYNPHQRSDSSGYERRSVVNVCRQDCKALLQANAVAYKQQLADIQARNTEAKHALAGATTRASQAQRQRLLDGAGTPGSTANTESPESQTVSTSQNITEGTQLCQWHSALHSHTITKLLTTSAASSTCGSPIRS